MPVQHRYPSLFIKLFNEQREPVSNAEFYLKKALYDKGLLLHPVFDPGLGVYSFTEQLQGDYFLTVVHKNYLPEVQPVILAPGKKTELVITLSDKERPYFILGNRRIFYTPVSEEQLATGTVTAAGKNLPSAHGNEKAMLQAGTILEAGEDRMIVLTSEITVKFKDSATEEQIKGFLAGFQLAISRVPKAVNLYQLHSSSGTDHELLELCKEIRFHPIVESIDSNAACTHKLHALHPSDYLYTEQWDHQLINVADAWENLQQDPQAAAKGNTAYFSGPVIPLYWKPCTPMQRSGRLKNS